jgi:hypothetical protein
MKRQAKEGRAISAASRARIEEAITHCKAMIDCLNQVLASDDAEEAKSTLARAWESYQGRLLN